jgi:hypothetical protein
VHGVWYSVHMRKQAEVLVCDVCGWEWLPKVENPEMCPSRKCRSRKWNKGKEEAALADEDLESLEADNVESGGSGDVVRVLRESPVELPMERPRGSESGRRKPDADTRAGIEGRKRPVEHNQPRAARCPRGDACMLKNGFKFCNYCFRSKTEAGAGESTS